MIMNINEIKSNNNNPRLITDIKLEQLKKSIKEFPKMLELRPLIIDENNVVLGGNMRLKACKELGITDIPVKKIEGLSQEQKNEFIIKDNLGYGEWDWDIIYEDWNIDELKDWGMDIKDNPVYTELHEQEEENQLWFLNIEFQDEADIEYWFDKLKNEGLTCKIIQ